jgi:hypothetical protein
MEASDHVDYSHFKPSNGFSGINWLRKHLTDACRTKERSKQMPQSSIMIKHSNTYHSLQVLAQEHT